MARRLLWLIPTSMIGLFLLLRLVVTSEVVSRELATEAAGELANRTRSSVQLSGLTFSWSFAPCFEHVEIYRYTGPYKIKVATEEACVERWSSAVGSGFHAVRIKLLRPSIELSGNPAGEAEPAFVDVKPTASEIGEKVKGTLREVQIVFDDLRLDWDSMPFPSRFASGTFGPIDGLITVQKRGNMSAASIALREPATRSSINGRVTPTPTGWNLSAGVEGDVVPIFDSLLEAASLDLRKLPSMGRIGVDYRSTERTATINLDLEQRDIDFANDIVSSSRLRGFNAHQKMRVDVDLDAGRLEIRDGLVEMNRIPLVFSVSVVPNESSPSFSLGVDLRTTSLPRLLRSVPGAVELEMTDKMSPSISFAFAFSMTGELKNPATWTPKLEHRFQGLGDGAESGIEYLSSQFEYRPLTEEGRASEPRKVGRGLPGWVEYKDVPYLQRRCILVSEDSTFFFHNGVELEEMRAAIEAALENGEKARGGSTLTQQLVKNLFLSRDRTALRKLQELLLTFYLESNLKKEYLFELYVNLIEWGPDIYGLHDASMHYFGRPPKKLTPKEMAYLAAIIPGPLLYHRQYERGHISAKMAGRVNGLLERLNRLGQLPDDQLAEAKEREDQVLQAEERRAQVRRLVETSGAFAHGRLDGEIELAEQAVVAIVLEALEVLRVARRAPQERPDALGGDLARALAVAELREVIRVEDLLELSYQRDREHRLAQVHGLAHQREATARDHGAGRRQIVDERGLREGTEGQVALDHRRRQITSQAVDPERAVDLGQLVDQRGVAGAGLIDNHVIAGSGAGLGVEDDVTKDRGMERGPRPIHGRIEEGGHQVVITAWELGAHDRLGEQVALRAVADDVVVVMASGDDLHVVDGHDRDALSLGEPVGPRLEVGDHHVRRELAGGLGIGAKVVRDVEDRLQVLQRGLHLLDHVVLVDHRQAGNLGDPSRMALGEILGGAARHHDPDVVPRTRQMVEHHRGAHRVPHTFTDDAVEDPHRSDTLHQLGTGPVGLRARRRC